MKALEIRDDWEAKVRSIAEFLGANEDELVSEMLPLLKEAYELGAADAMK